MKEMVWDGEHYLALTAWDADTLVRSLKELVKLAERYAGVPIGLRAREALNVLEEFLGRVAGSADATTQPQFGHFVNDEVEPVVSTDTAAELLKISPAAVRKRCERGRYSAVARKEGGRWWIPLEDIKIEIEAMSQMRSGR